MFVKEKDVLIDDVTNLTAYFNSLLVTDTDKGTKSEKEFPFVMIINRISHILEKYQEQPALLDVVISQMVQMIMDSVQKYVEHILK